MEKRISTMPPTDEQDVGKTRSESQSQAILAKVEALERDRERNRKLLRKRPLGVTFIAFFLALYAAVLFVAIGWAWSHPGKIHSWMTPQNGLDLAMSVVIFAPLQMLMAGVLSYSLWNLQDWARHGTVSFGALSLYGGLRGALGHDFSRAYLMRVLVVLLVAAYFYQPSVAASFVLRDETRV
jgi:hypothetical protein